MWSGPQPVARVPTLTPRESQTLNIFAHRGLFKDPSKPIENSMRALDLAFRSGFSVETDFRWGIDRQILVFHDANLSRIFGEEKATQEISSAELRERHEALSHSTEPGPADLEELLRWPYLATGLSVLVNIKEPDDPDFVAAVCESILSANRTQATWLFDMNQALIPELHRAFPSIRFLARLSHLEDETIERVRALSDAVAGIWFDDYFGDLLGSPVEEKASKLGLGLFYVSPELHPDTHPLGKKGYARAWRHVMRNDAFAGICTDHPRHLRESMKGTRNTA